MVDGSSEYEKISDSAEKRAQDSKSLTNKQSVHADLKTELGDECDGLKLDQAKLLSIESVILSTHLGCDWLSGQVKLILWDAFRRFFAVLIMLGKSNHVDRRLVV